jgi:hypothetical protein
MPLFIGLRQDWVADALDSNAINDCGLYLNAVSVGTRYEGTFPGFSPRTVIARLERLGQVGPDHQGQLEAVYDVQHGCLAG